MPITALLTAAVLALQGAPIHTPQAYIPAMGAKKTERVALRSV